MKIWGYLLAVLNVGAAAAFLYFATAVWKARSEWQFALLKQNLVNRGLPLQAPAKPPEDLNDDSVPFDFKYGAASIDQISKKALAKLIPPGGDELGVKGGIVVSNQDEEVARVQKIIFGNLEAAARPEKRMRLFVLLLNLSSNTGRQGVYALLRDFPEEKWRAYGRDDIASLGRSPAQESALKAMNAVGVAQSGFAGDKIAPAVTAERSLEGRKQLMIWAFSEVARIGDGDTTAAKDEQKSLNGVLLALKPEMEAAMPAAANLEAAKKQLTDLLEGDTRLQSASARTLIPYIAKIATNPLDSEAKVLEAKANLLELMQFRATSTAEKNALTALADLLVPKGGVAEKDQIDANIDLAATELLRAYFEEALAKPSTDLPEDVGQARSKLKDARPIRDFEEKRSRIAHLLYHLDAHVGATKEYLDMWYRTFIKPEEAKASADEPPGDGGFKMRTVDRNLLAARAKWHQRVVAVVGLEAYVPVVEAQASQFSNRFQAVQTRVMDEQRKFEKDYEAVIRETKTLAMKLDIKRAEVEEQKKIRADAQARLDGRTAEKTALLGQKEAADAAATTALKKLADKVDELFQITVELGAAQDALIGLEVKLRDLEFGTLDKKKK